MAMTPENLPFFPVPGTGTAFFLGLPVPGCVVHSCWDLRWQEGGDGSVGRERRAAPVRCLAACLFAHRACKPEILVVPRGRWFWANALCSVELV